MADDEDQDMGDAPAISEMLLRPKEDDYEAMFNDEEKLVLTTVVSKRCCICANVTKELSKLTQEDEWANAKLKFILADADETPSLAKKLGVCSVPHFFLSHKGEVWENFSGSNIGKLTALLKNCNVKRNEVMKEYDAAKKAAEEEAKKAAEEEGEDKAE